MAKTFNNGDQRLDIRTKINASIAESVTIIKQASDLSGTLSSSEVYVVDGPINMGTQTVTRPTGGLSLRGAGSVTDALFSTEDNYTMFTDADDAGHFIASGISFSTSGTNSKVFDIESSGGTDIFSITRCAFVSCTAIGSVKGYGVMLIDGVQDINCTNGYTPDGDVILLSITGCASTGLASGGVLFKAGGSLSVLNNCIIEKGTFIMDSGATLCDFASANIAQDAGFEVIINNISGAGTFFSDLNGDNVKCRWRDNNFDPAASETNTYVGAWWEMTAEAVTTVSASGTDYKIAGVTTSADEHWFSHATNNEFTADSTRSVKTVIQGAVSITGTNGHEIQLKIRKYDNSAAGYVDIQTVPGRVMSSTGAAASVAILAFVTIDDPLDRIELWGQNVSATGNFTIKNNSVLSITERAN